MTDEHLRKAIAKAQTVADRQALNLSTLLHAIEQGKSILEGKEPRASRVWVENVLRFPSVAFHECHDFSNASEQYANKKERVFVVPEPMYETKPDLTNGGFTHVLSGPIPGQLWITLNGRKLLRTDNLPKPLRKALAWLMRRVGR